MFQILCNPFGLIIIYFCINLLLKNIFAYTIIQDNIILNDIQPLIPEKTQEDNGLVKKEITLTLDTKVQEEKQEPDEPLDDFTKREIERIVKEREFDDIIKIAEEQAFLEEHMEYYSEPIINTEAIENTSSKKIIATNVSMAPVWDLSPATVHNILSNYALAREQANYEADILVLMNFVKDTIPVNILDIYCESAEAGNYSRELYLATFFDNIKFLPPASWNEAYYQFKFYKITIITYNTCLTANTLNNPFEVQLIFDLERLVQQ